MGIFYPLSKILRNLSLSPGKAGTGMILDSGFRLRRIRRILFNFGIIFGLLFWLVLWSVYKPDLL